MASTPQQASSFKPIPPPELSIQPNIIYWDNGRIRYLTLRDKQFRPVWDKSGGTWGSAVAFLSDKWKEMNVKFPQFENEIKLDATQQVVLSGQYDPTIELFKFSAYIM